MTSEIVAIMAIMETINKHSKKNLNSSSKTIKKDGMQLPKEGQLLSRQLKSL